MSIISSIIFSSIFKYGTGFGGISLFGGLRDNINNDIDCIKQYNAELDRCVSTQTAWYRTMQSSSPVAQKLVENANYGKVAINGLTGKLIAGKVAMIGMRVASVALNMALTMGLSLGIQALVGLFDDLIHAQENEAKASEERAEQAKKRADESKSEVDTINELISKYEKLKSSEELDSKGRKEIASIEADITDLVGERANKLNLVNGELKTQLQYLKDIRKEEAKTAYGDAEDAIFQSIENIRKNSQTLDYRYGKGIALGTQNFTQVEQGDVLKDFEEIASKYNATFYNQAPLAAQEMRIMFTEDHTLADTISMIDEYMEYYRTNDNIKERRGDSKHFEEFEKLQEDLSKYTKDLQSNVKTIISMNNVMNGYEERSIHSLEEYRKLRQDIINDLLENSAIDEGLKEGLFSQDLIEKYVDNWLNGVDSFAKYSQYVSDTSKSISNNIDKISFSDLISDEDFKDKVDDYKDKITELDEAIEDLRNGGLSEEDKIELFENFPELAGQADNLDEAIVNLINDTENSAISDFNEQLSNMDTDDDVAALNALKNSILGLAKTAGSDVDIERLNEILNHLETKESCDNIDKLTEKMKSYADEYNRLVGYGKKGNVDYNKRPVVSKEDVKAVYPEFDGNYATTYDQGYQVLDSKGKGYAVVVTPILENGEILSQQELDDYIDNVINGSDDILKADTKNLIIHAEAEGEGDYWIKNSDGTLEFDWEGFNDALIPAKEGHLETYLDINTNIDDLIPYAEKLGISVEQLLQMRDVPSFLFNSAEETAENIKKLKTALDDLSDTYSNMKSIIDDYNENGYLTLDNLQSIMDMQPEYINLLIDENGQINLNNQAYKEYVASKAKSLLVNELQDLYSSILGMKVEEAQAYANAKAYNEETGSVKDLLTATTELYYAKAIAKDSANNTTVYTDAMSRSFKTAANYASIVESYINSLSTSQNEFSTATEETTSALEEQKDALESQKDTLEDYKESLEDTKDALEDYKDSLETAKNDLQSLIDITVDYIKQTKEDEKSALEDQIDTLDKQKEALDNQKDAYAELISKRKEEIEALYDEKEAEDELADKHNSVAKDRLALEIAALDDSSAGRKAYKQARDQLNGSEKDLKDYLNEQSKDKRIAALEEEQEKYEETIEKQKTAVDEQVEHLEAKIDEIDAYLNNSRKLYEDACNMIDNDNGELYNNLWNYTYQYTTKTKAEFDYLWSSAQTAIQKYKGDNDTLIVTMETLQQKIYDTDSEIEDLNIQINDCETQIGYLDDAISNTSDAISATSDSIQGVSSSIGGLGDSVSYYADQLEKLKKVAESSATQTSTDNNSEGTSFWVKYLGKKYTTTTKYNGDTTENRRKAAYELAQQFTGTGPVSYTILENFRRLLGVADNSSYTHSKWYYDSEIGRFSSNKSDKNNAVKDILSQMKKNNSYWSINPKGLESKILSGLKHYASGTRNSPAEFISQEKGLEAIFAKNPNGSGSYTLTTPDSQVFDAKRTDNLYDFSGNPEAFIAKLAERGLSLLSSDELSAFGWDSSLMTSQVFDKMFNSSDFVKNLTGISGTTYNNDNSANNQNINFNMPIYIQGNADQYAVQALNNAADTIKTNIFKELTRMGGWNRRLK